MILANENFYNFMFGEISKNAKVSEQCMSQCTGCMCNCRCSCSGGMTLEMEWEVL